MLAGPPPQYLRCGRALTKVRGYHRFIDVPKYQAYALTHDDNDGTDSAAYSREIALRTCGMQMTAGDRRVGATGARGSASTSA